MGRKPGFGHKLGSAAHCVASGKPLNLSESQFPHLKWDSTGYLQLGEGS